MTGKIETIHFLQYKMIKAYSLLNFLSSRETLAEGIKICVENSLHLDLKVQKQSSFWSRSGQ